MKHPPEWLWRLLHRMEKWASLASAAHSASYSIACGSSTIATLYNVFSAHFGYILTPSPFRADVIHKISQSLPKIARRGRPPAASLAPLVDVEPLMDGEREREEVAGLNPQ